MSIKHVSELPDAIAYVVSSWRGNTNKTLEAVTDEDYITLHIGPVQLTMSPGNWSFVQEIIGDAIKALGDLAPAPPTFRIVIDDDKRTAVIS